MVPRGKCPSHPRTWGSTSTPDTEVGSLPSQVPYTYRHLSSGVAPSPVPSEVRLGRDAQGGSGTEPTTLDMGLRRLRWSRTGLPVDLRDWDRGDSRDQRLHP